MVAGASLLSTMQKTSQNWQTQNTTPAIASVKVGDVVGDNTEAPKKSFITRIIENLKNRLIQKELQNLKAFLLNKEPRTSRRNLMLTNNP